MVTLTIEGAPRTKKNSLRRLKRGKRVYTVGSEAHATWAEKAMWQLRQQWREVPIAADVSVRALVYREKLTGDLVGYLQAIADVLEHARVLNNDKQIVSWDGSRPLKDAARPRVEIQIEVLP